MRAGQLRQRITILSPVQSTSPTGANSKLKFEETAKLWANVEPLSVKDILTAQAVGSQARLRCVIRYRSDIGSHQRVKYLDKVYKIDGEPLADKNTGREYLTLLLVSVS